MMNQFDPLIPVYKTLSTNPDIIQSRCNIIAINFDTILRCVLAIMHNPPVPNYNVLTNELFNAISSIIDNSFHYIFNAQKVRSLKNINYCILLYKINYSYIPEEMKRKNKQLEYLFNISNELLINKEVITSIDNILKERQQYMNQNFMDSTINVEVLTNIQPSGIQSNIKFLHLFKEIVQKVRTNRNIIFISHFPVDFHIPCDKLYLIDTFTGNIWQKQHLNEKYFQTPFIVFSKLTHGLFGDRHLLKPLIDRKTKKEINQMLLHEGKVWNDTNLISFFKEFTKYHLLTKLKLINEVL